MKTVYVHMKCEVEGCDNTQFGVVYDQTDYTLKSVCKSCGEGIIEKRSPEYIVSCPNCFCEFGVN